MDVVLIGRKPKTKKNYLTLLKTILNYAVKWGYIDHNPIANMKPPKVVKTFHFFNNDEMKLILEKSKEPLNTGIVLLANTGIRRAELYHLRWKDVDLKTEQIRVWPYEGFVPKGKRPRAIPLNDEAFKTIKVLKKSRNKTEFVFRPYKSIYYLREKFTELLKELGIKGTLHDLRHTFASHLAMAGVPIPVISELLGHSNLSTTEVYAHLSPGIHKIQVKKLKF